MFNIISRLILLSLQAVLFGAVPILIMGVFVSIGLSFFYDFTLMDALHKIGISITVYIFLSLISPVFTSILVLLSGARTPSIQELDFIIPALNDVIDSCGFKKNISVSVIDDNLQSNAMVMGRTIIFTSGILNNSSDDEIRGVIAHELGHIVHGDSYFNAVSNFLSQPMTFLLAIFNGLATIGNSLPILKLLVSVPINIMIGLINIILIIVGVFAMSLSRGCEYKADRYAFKNGYLDGLISFLELTSQSQTKRNFLQAMADTHPSPQKRILRLQKLEEYGK